MYKKYWATIPVGGKYLYPIEILGHDIYYIYMLLNSYFYLFYHFFDH